MLQKRSDHSQENRIEDALYPRLLGVVWSDIDSALKRMHCNGEPVRASGLFQINHGTSLLAKLFSLFLRLPPRTPAAQIDLIVRPKGQSETWLRVFDGKPLVTVQREASAGRLAERFGALEFQFHLEFADHTIHYEQVGVLLRLPLLSEIPLPSWASPHVSAWETAGENEMEIRISVEISAPFAGLLLSYEGEIRLEEV